MPHNIELAKSKLNVVAKVTGIRHAHDEPSSTAGGTSGAFEKAGDSVSKQIDLAKMMQREAESAMQRLHNIQSNRGQGNGGKGGSNKKNGRGKGNNNGGLSHQMNNGNMGTRGFKRKW